MHNRTRGAVRPLAERIIAERGNLLHLYQMLMHSGPVAEGWLTYLTAIRQKTTLSGALREMIIMRVALLNTELLAIFGDPSFKEKWLEIGSDIVVGSLEQFDAFIASEMKRWGRIVTDAKIEQE